MLTYNYRVSEDSLEGQTPTCIVGNKGGYNNDRVFKVNLNDMDISRTPAEYGINKSVATF